MSKRKAIDFCIKQWKGDIVTRKDAANKGPGPAPLVN